MNVNVLDRATLLDAMEHPERYPQLTIRVSGYAVNFVRLTREQQLDVVNRTFHHERPDHGRRVTGSVHSWDLSTGVDGPGTRFVVFTAGCPLRCVYCHNPDTWAGRAGQRMSAAEVLALAAGTGGSSRASGGGLTVSGGEPLLQPAFTRAVLAGAKELGLHTALDTSGYLGARADDDLLDATDLVLLDIKSFDPPSPGG